MSKPEDSNGEDKPQGLVDEALELGELKSAVTLAKETLTGDLRDAALNWIRLLKKPWPQLSEDEQRDVIASISRQATHAAAQAIEIIASHKPGSVSVHFKKFTADDGLKISLEATETEGNAVALLRLRGLRATISAADVSPFVGEKEPANPEPDQRAIPGTDDGAKEAH